MSIREYYTQRIIDIQNMLFDLGDTEKRIWRALTDGINLSSGEFALRVTEKGIPITPNEAKIIWKMCGIDKHLIERSDLSTFLRAELADLKVDENTPPAEDILMDQRDILLSLCLEKDEGLNGIILRQDLEKISKKIDSSLTVLRIEDLMNKLDMFQTGRIDYFLLMSQLCTRNKKRTHPKIDTPNLIISQRNKKKRSMSLLTPINESSKQPTHGRRGPLDDELFSTRIPKPPDNIMEQETSFEHLQPLEGAGRREILALISKTVDTCYKSRKKCYKEWRGYDEYLLADGIQKGMAKSAQLYIPLMDLEKVTALYGENITLGSFVKMIGDGSRFLKAKNQKRIARNKIGASTIRYIARNLTNKNWKSILEEVSSPETLVERMLDEGIYLTSDEISMLAHKMTKDEIMSAIEEEIRQL